MLDTLSLKLTTSGCGSLAGRGAGVLASGGDRAHAGGDPVVLAPVDLAPVDLAPVDLATN